MSQSLTDMTTAIKNGLLVSGLTVYDLETLKESVSDSGKVLQPEPTNFCSIVNEAVANGAGGERPYDITTTLRYKLFYAPVGAAGSSIAVPYAKMADMAKAIVDAVLDTAPLAGSEMSVSAVNFGPVVDPNGKAFHGCEIVFTVYELVR